MSFLAPLYALGALAIAAPLFFHLIRRTPRGEMPFSSLMFLTPSPPKVTRRSRLDDWLLLALRALALVLIAFAFARPFFRQQALADPGDTPGRRVVLLVDTSASMRLADLWAKAKKIASDVIETADARDKLALLAFDNQTRIMLSFEESATLDPARRKAVALARLNELAPTWGGTHLGQALVDAVSAVSGGNDATGSAGHVPRRVILVSDLPRGARLDELGGLEWPSDVTLEPMRVADLGSNAGIHPLADAEPETGKNKSAADKGLGPDRRVGVSNDTASHKDAFTLSWVDETGKTVGDPISTYVPAGESRVVRVPRPVNTNRKRVSLVLQGDDSAFDNTLAFADPIRDEANVVALTNDAADDPSGSLYYLMRVFQDDPKRGVKVNAIATSASLSLDPRAVSLAVVLGETNAENGSRLREYARAGGTVFAVVNGPGSLATVATIAGVAPFEAAESSNNRDMMLGEIAFEHPLFAPLAGPQFNDFTKIRFWKHRKVAANALGESRVIARFENGDPALIEKTVGKGRLLLMTSSWRPADSQLARSSKFVPLMAGLLESRERRPDTDAIYTIGDRIPLPASVDPAMSLTIRKPDGKSSAVAKGASAFEGADQPGVYVADLKGVPWSFAVNLDPAESKTSPLADETLEQLGCRLARSEMAAANPEELRQLQNAELEGRQKYWRWLVLAAVAALTVETWLAGRLARPRTVQAGEAVSA